MASVCLPDVTDSSDFYRLHMRRLHPVFPLLAFQLGFSGIPEIHEKTAKSRSGSDPVGPCFGTLFCYFFLKKFSFSLEGLVKVRYLVLARTRDDFGATLSGGSI